MINISRYNIIRVFDPDAFEKNLNITLQQTKNKLGIVIKSDAYGIGLKNILPICKKYNITNYFCQNIQEGIEARKFLKDSKYNIFIFEGALSNQYNDLIKYNLIPICVSLVQLNDFNSYSKELKRKPLCGIHFDTGMNRTGLSKNEVKILRNNFESYTKYLNVILYISHLHSSYDKNKKTNLQQLIEFESITKTLPYAIKSLSATGGAFYLNEKYHFDLLRVGYGLLGMIRKTKPVQSIYARILQSKTIEKNKTIGYFGSFKTKSKIKIAVINIGYNDGYDRGLSHTNTFFDKIRNIFRSGANFTKSYMTINGIYKCPVIGIISMNNTIIDVSKVPDNVLGKTNFAEVIGNHANLLDFRSANGFIPADMLVSLMRSNYNAIDISKKDFETLNIK